MTSRSTRPIATLVRSFSTTSSTSAGAPAAPSDAIQAQRRKGERPIGVKHSLSLRPFEYNDIPWLGYLKMFQMREALELGEKVKDHEAALRAQHKPFIPPTGAIRIVNSIQMRTMSTKKARRVTLLAPISSLPLNGPDAVHRCKIIAGPRFSPGKPGLTELEIDSTTEGKDGWVNISEDRFEEMRMNRKAASDMLDRLIEAANDPKSPISTELPVDLRHLYARRRRQKEGMTHSQTQVKAARSKASGDLGFPKAWLSEEVTQKALIGREQ